MSPRPLLFLAALLLGLSACSYSTHLGLGPSFEGSGVFAGDVRHPAEFEHVEVLGSIDLVVRVGQATQLEVTGDDNLLSRVRTEVHEGRLRVQLESGSYELNRPLTVSVSTPRLRSVVIQGSGDAKISGLTSGSLSLSVLGSGDVTAAGRLDRLEATVQGSGDMELRDLHARFVEASVQGSGDLTLYAEEGLVASVQGSGDIDYWGSPREREIESFGSGEVTAH
jgi:hypothetical protein